jgi:transcriptional regulator with XRE-family HTH domain
MKMNYRITLGKNISKLRKEKGLSQEKFAEACNLHRTYIGAVERGERNITIDNIEKICMALEIDIKQLFEERKDVKNEKL